MKNDLNFLDMYKTQFKWEKEDSINLLTAKNLTICCVPVIILVVYIASLGVINYRLNLKISSETDFINSTIVSNQYKNIQENKSKYLNMVSYNKISEGVQNIIENYPKVTLDEYNAVKNSLEDNMDLIGITYSDGVFTPYIATENISKIPDVITNIRHLDVFDDVKYTGFLSPNALSTKYIFTPECYVKRGDENAK